MKIIALVVFFSVVYGCIHAVAQAPVTLPKYIKDCCKKTATVPSGSQITNNLYKMDTTVKNKPLACKLTTPELQKRKEEVLALIKLKIQEKEELSNGYRYRFAAVDSTTDQLVAFIKSERLCCDFFDFTLAFTGEETWLSITGPEGTKGFLKLELDL